MYINEKMKLQQPKHPNYCATVIRVKNLVELPNCENVVAVAFMGMQAIVGKDTQVGDIGILFPTEAQLSEDYCSFNNLFRHAELNKDTTKPGYLEDNRRVKSLKFRGHRSDALFMPLNSLTYLGINDFTPFKEGIEFDSIDGNEICNKYELPVSGIQRGANKTKSRVPARVDSKHFPEQGHVYHFLKVLENLDSDTRVVVTQKLHGTNIRVGNVQVNRKLSFIERIARRIGIHVSNHEFAYCYGSHHVIKYSNNVDYKHYYDEDLWTLKGHELDGLLPHNFVVYGELVGYTSNGSPIQSHYTYDQPVGKCKLYIYRVAVVNDEGFIVDLSWDAVREFCDSIGFAHVPELTRCSIEVLTMQRYSGVNLLDEFMDVDFGILTWLTDNPVPLAPDSPCDEGVVVRIEGINPQLYKVKAPMYLAHETKELDKGVPDIESSQQDAN